MIDWNKYQAEALTTAIYPLERELDYTILGLCSEVGEVAELPLHSISTTSFEAQMKSELGDVAWYVAAVADALKTPLQEIADGGKANIAGGEGLTAGVLMLVSSSAYMAGLLKKSIRDDAGHVSDERRDAMKVELERIIKLFDMLCQQLGTTAHAVTQANLNKLSDRKQRGVLQGAGNHR